MKAIFVQKSGGPEVLDGPLPIKLADTVPADSALVEMRFAGLNFIDTYYRSGLYTKPTGFPFVTGDEGSGVVVKLPEGVSTSLTVGSRVAFFRGSTGAVSTHAFVKLQDCFPIPPNLTDEEAAAALLQGCTAHYLVRSCFPVGKGTVVLVQAAAGGTGLLISQMCHLLGATVIGTCGGEPKAEIAKSVGKVDFVVDYRRTSCWADEVLRITTEELGREVGGVDVVFDGVGQATFLHGLAVLKKRGSMVTFGNASGPVENVSPLLLTQFGSVSLQRPTLKDFAAAGGEIEGRVAELFGWIANGDVRLTIGRVFPMSEIQEAHRFLEGRSSTGKIIISCQE